MHKTPIQKYEEIMRMGRRLHEEHEWRSHTALPTERRMRGMVDAAIINDNSSKWDWFLWTAYISMCIGSMMLALWWFFPNLWR